MIDTPRLSEADPLLSSEGALDPLGLYAIADSLAVRLCPGVRERQTRPRWLTVIAAGLVVCADFDADRIAADGSTEPWQVYEWHIVEGLARTSTEDDGVLRMPGLLKARQAIRDGVRLNAGRYLKTPSVFGLHGVYRLLGRSVGIESHGRLGDFGVGLIQAWSHERELAGFHQAAAGSGYAFRRQLQQAVEDALNAGEVSRGPGWAGWEEIRRHFAPADLGPEEARTILVALQDSGAGYRAGLLKALTEGEGSRLWEETGSERAFHAWLRERSAPELGELLDAIASYEAFARSLQDAFDDCLYLMTRKRGRTTPAELAGATAVKKCCDQVHARFLDAADRLARFDREAAEFRQRFAELGVMTTPADWVQRLMGHHRVIQRNKPPAGKNPWLERFDDGSYAVRAAYRREHPADGAGEYVHAYRSAPLSSFLQDLKGKA